MNDIGKKRQKLRLILAEAHRQKQSGLPQPSQAWRKSVMSRLPGLDSLAARMDQWAVIERLVWRFVPAAGALTLVLAIMVSQYAFDPAADVARMMSANSADSGLYSYYQSELGDE